MAVDLYAGIYVRDIRAATSWYARLLGSEPSFVTSATEAELAEHRCIAIEEKPGHAGHSIVTIFVDDFDIRVEQIAERGIEPTERLTYRNGVRKALYRDPDGNEIGLGGAPVGTG
ncbi:VOC family protein [Devosia ginsengisoli]|uniref:VOC family protein n=1 Tax=Devosia ginsengisoli TaxID=400770 RepID=UPI0026F1AB98|nr:VOC family protein [Devosia ginsengisoli]MCR6671046.1 VOC family protein [Devosia ginsengisoli]